MEYEIFLNEDLNLFSQRVFNSFKIEKNREYNILLKVQKGDVYLMIADKQQHFKYNSINDIQFEILFNNIIDFIYYTFSEYPKELEYTFDDLLLEFWEVKIDENLKIYNLEPLSSESSLNKNEIVSVKREFDIFGPMLQLHGIQLDIRFNGYGMMEIFSEVLKTEKFLRDFVQVFNKEVNNKNKRFLGFSNDKCEILPIKINTYKQYIAICSKINNFLIEKSCYNMYGSFIGKVKDSYLSLEAGGKFIHKRESKNKIYYFNSSNEVACVERKITFDSIRSDFRNISVENESKNWIPNTNIGVLDLEAYIDDNSLAKCYAIGFLTNKQDSSCKTFYINRDLDSVELTHRCINEMLKPKYKDITFYSHNLGRYDSAFILKNLILYNNNTKEGKESPYILEPITRNSDIIKLVVKRNIDGKIRRVKIQDSATILTSSLRDLCLAYGVKINKSYFPYEFCNRDTLFYIGSTPDINFYKNITREEYMLLYKKVWSLQEESIIYLEKDLYSLYEVLDKVNKGMFLLFKKQMTNSLTISGFSSRLYLEDYYLKDKAPLPLILNRTCWLHIHKAYFGGRNEVLTPIVKDKIAYYYDVNSLYPYAMLNPMSGLNWLYVECISTSLELNTNKIELNENLFGWFYCKVKTTNNYLGLLPYRTPEGNLIFPVGTWYGWYFSEELKFARDNEGYEIEIIKGYKTDISYGAFDRYVKEVYDIKANPRNKVERNISKLILNSGIGRFGMDYLKPVTKLLNEKEHNLVLVSRVLKNSLQIDYNTYLDTYLPGVNKEVCKENGVDHTKVLNLENFNEKTNLGNYTAVSISTAAATLAYSRIHLAKFLLYILEHGGNIYYMDTDSIITDFKLPEEFISQNELGKLKLEHIIKEGYFVADKTYCIVDVDGNIIKRAKGVNAESLTLEDYRKMYELETVKAEKVSSFRDYTEGSVVIKTKKDVKLNPSHYNKRIRVYDENNKWVGTKPVYIDINSPEE